MNALVEALFCAVFHQRIAVVPPGWADNGVLLSRFIGLASGASEFRFEFGDRARRTTVERFEEKGA